MNVMAYFALLGAVLAGCIVWPFLRGTRSTGPSQTVDGIPCDFRQITASRTNQATVTVALPCDERFEFTLRREGSFDRMAKSLGIVREFQTGDASFDERVYIGSDETGFDAWLQSDRNAQNDFLELLAMTPEENTRITKISATGGSLTLSAIAKPPAFKKAPDDLARTVAQVSVQKLKSCLDRLQAYASSQADPEAFRDPYAGRIRALTALALGLLFGSMLVVIVGTLIQPTRIEFPENPFTDSAVWILMACLLSAVTMLTVLLLRGSSRLHTVLATLLIAVSIGTVIAGPIFIREINAQWDESAPDRYSAQVLDEHVSAGRRRFYKVDLTDWHSQSDYVELNVDAATYNSVRVGETVTVTERQGYLHRPWVSGVKRAKAATTDVN